MFIREAENLPFHAFGASNAALLEFYLVDIYWTTFVLRKKWVISKRNFFFIWLRKHNYQVLQRSPSHFRHLDRISKRSVSLFLYYIKALFFFLYYIISKRIISFSVNGNLLLIDCLLSLKQDLSLLHTEKIVEVQMIV